MFWLFISSAPSCVCLRFLNLEIVASVFLQNILLSSNDLEDLLGRPEDESFFGLGRAVSKRYWSLIADKHLSALYSCVENPLLIKVLKTKQKSRQLPGLHSCVLKL